MQKTRKSMVYTGLTILACIAMLVAVTFAWFTDSIVNKGNKITAGDFGLKLSQWDSSQSEYVEIPDGANKPIIDSNMKFEPGFTDIHHFKIEDTGDLSLEFEFGLQLDEGQQAGKLADQIDVYVLGKSNLEDKPENLPHSFDDFINGGAEKVGTLAEILAGKPVHGHGMSLYNDGKGLEYFSMALHMPTDVSMGDIVDNTRAAGDELSTGTFSAVLKAKQMDDEEDGFGDSHYDENAPFYPVVIGDDESIGDAITNLEDGQTLMLESGKTYNETISIPADKNIGIDGNGAKLSVTSGSGVSVPAGANVKISNLDIEKTGNHGIEMSPSVKNVILDNCTIDGVGGRAIYINGTTPESQITIQNCTIKKSGMNIEGVNGAVSQNITLKNNNFSSFSNAITFNGAIKNITVENNTFNIIGKVRIYSGLTSAENVKFTDNKNLKFTVDDAAKTVWEKAINDGQVIITPEA